MTSLAARVLASLRRRRLCDPHARILAAVSGGADSVALTHLLAELSNAGALALVGVAHLDHRLRGTESDRDREFCAALAANLDLPFDVEQIDVLTEAARHRESIEQTARAVRYEYLERARTRRGADRVAVAHTRDDQAETVLLRLLRGAGTRGLAAILPSRDHVIRPLIDLRRSEILGYLEGHGHTWVEDSTNEDRRILRNWVRRDLLPTIVARVGDGVTDVLARTADSAREDEALLDELAAAAEARLRSDAGEAASVDAVRLLREPPAIARRVVRRLLESVGGRPAAWAHVAAVLELAAADAASIQAAGCDVKLSSADRVLYFRGVAKPAGGGGASAPPAFASSEVESRPLPVPGSVDLPESGLRLRAERRELAEVGGIPGLSAEGPSRAVIPAASAEPGLFVRTWLPGDVMHPLGLFGRKKVQDLFVDRKVPRGARQAVPIVTAADGRIVWVAGVALGEAFRVTPATKSVVVLSFESLGGSSR
jgi:tRNA(Ile)-lysidine synthase